MNRAFALILVLAAGLSGVACNQASDLTGPSSTGGSDARPGGVTSAVADATVVTFENFDPATVSVTVKTTTTSDLLINGKIHLQILVDAAGNPVPCGTPGGTYVRFDQVGGGIDVTGGVTTHNVDLDDLSSRDLGILDALCGQTICIRAQYVPGPGPGPSKAGQHVSADTPFTIECGTCALGFGYWKNHGPIAPGGQSNEWPVTSLMLGTTNYTDLQLLDIMNTEPGGGPGSNGLISLAHHLIAAKLNVANGASSPTIAATIAAADALIGNLIVPPVGGGHLASNVVGALKDALEAFNEAECFGAGLP